MWKRFTDELFLRFALLWRAAGGPLRPRSDSGCDRPRILVLPPDIRDPVGSRGDQAMLFAALATLRDRFPSHSIAIATTHGKLHASLRDHGADGALVWPRHWSFAESWRITREFDLLVIIGADVLDGAYDSKGSLRLLVLAERYAAWRGRDAVIVTGASFNKCPASIVRRFLKRKLSPEFGMALRDPQSLGRFTQLAPGHGRLVADCAFLLGARETDATQCVADWIAGRKEVGRMVVGVNLHPLLSRGDKTHSEQLVTLFAERLGQAIDGGGVSVCLLPHDFRDGDLGDIALLGTLAEHLGRRDQVLQVTASLAADELKAIASDLDHLFSARMHLAIAALGSGVPVAGIGYQDKLEGLLTDHFGLPPSSILQATEATDARKFTEWFEAAIIERGARADLVRQNLPRVLELAGENFRD